MLFENWKSCIGGFPMLKLNQYLESEKLTISECIDFYLAEFQSFVSVLTGKGEAGIAQQFFVVQDSLNEDLGVLLHETNEKIDWIRENFAGGEDELECFTTNAHRIVTEAIVQIKELYSDAIEDITIILLKVVNNDEPEIELVNNDAIKTAGIVAFCKFKSFIEELEVKKEPDGEWVKGSFDRLTRNFAKVIWLRDGAQKDSNLERIRGDWFAAKKFLGLLIAERFLQRCINDKGKSQSPRYCFNSFRKEYVDFLISLSVEEFIKIKSYLLWGDGNNWNPGDVDECISESNYLKAFDYLHTTKFNCQSNSMKVSFGNVPDEIKAFVSLFDKDKVLRYKGVHPQYTNEYNEHVEYCNLFYGTVGSALAERHLSEQDAHKLLDIFYTNTTLPNMLDFLLKCPICSAVTAEYYSSLKKSEIDIN